MTEEEAFLQVIAERPDADAPRLMYADWLEERGDPRGEFIRVQCALARMGPDDPRRPELKARERVLLADHQGQWVAPLRGIVYGWLFRRGFVEAIRARGQTFLEQAERLFALAPVQQAWLSDANWCVPDLAGSRYLAQLRALSLDANGIGDAGVRALAESPHASRLTALDLAGNQVSDAGVQHLANSSHLGGLLSLRLSMNHVRDEGAQALAATRCLVRLETLNLFENRIGDAGAFALARSPRLTRLDTLYLGGNSISDDAIPLLRARLGRRVVI
jgi:uncharacterized protein (TIGR02996 family)